MEDHGVTPRPLTRRSSGLGTGGPRVSRLLQGRPRPPDRRRRRHLDRHSYTVVAVSKDGLRTAETVSYTVKK